MRSMKPIPDFLKKLNKARLLICYSYKKKFHCEKLTEQHKIMVWIRLELDI